MHQASTSKSNSDPLDRGAHPKRRSRRPDRSERSLVCLVQSLVERRIVIELRNDVIVRGHVDSVDEFMNMTLSAVKVQTLEGIRSNYEFMYLKGRNVRYIHLPAALDVKEALDDQRKKTIEMRMEDLKYRLRNPLSALVKGDGGEGHHHDQQMMMRDSRLHDNSLHPVDSSTAHVSGPSSSRNNSQHQVSFSLWSHGQQSQSDQMRNVPLSSASSKGVQISYNNSELSHLHGSLRSSSAAVTALQAGMQLQEAEEADKAHDHHTEYDESVVEAERERMLKEMEEGFDFDLGDEDDVYCD
ncbi:hypothetical protein CEUSTIGMA_g8128.t1 [Chlamydomonas eustigma]|uniref:Sm domain-containing protein n=1 Tax=Chlamydomonas eustigma TaxID=1157962 RepID=A0A250XC85_9CHLO|nr:hypothetical protein CEUSTIGMA_g8128.t1 [Chlamydomonas eustigma]|eukprot:GAX80693.1 hypothetical protein CEUSTIGMA_g8128.t1 [Chlamydomonas eustigma]